MCILGQVSIQTLFKRKVWIKLKSLLFKTTSLIFRYLKNKPFATFKWPFATCAEWRMGWTTLAKSIKRKSISSTHVYTSVDTIMLVKRNGSFCANLCAHGHLLFGLNGWWNWPLESISPIFYERNCADFRAPIKSLTLTSSTKKALCETYLQKSRA